MYIKVYFDNKPVYLCDEVAEEWSGVLQHPDTIYTSDVSPSAIACLLRQVNTEKFHAGVLRHNNLEHLKDQFSQHFTPIAAAGGIVKNEAGELLFIYRLKKWDLPKGKVEAGEDIADCAMREVEEETGVKHLQMQRKIGETYHTYNAYGRQFFKTTHWYYFTCTSNQPTVPQIEEDIQAVKWVPANGLDEPLADSYPSIKDILTTFLSLQNS